MILFWATQLVVNKTRTRTQISQVRVCVCVLSHFSCVQLFVTLRTTAHQTPLSTGILQERILEWIAMPFSRDFPHPEIEPESPALLPWWLRG